MNKYIALIPAYKPTNRLIELLKELSKLGLENIVVDDGSGIEYNQIFSEASKYAKVLEHNENKGKGCALKTGLAYIADNYSKSIVVTVDADGQHKPNDVMDVCKCAEKHLDGLVLGTRTFNQGVPIRSKLGNTITCFVFHLSTGVKLQDTQTGLRAFSTEMIPELLKISGERYEYEMNVLLQFARNHTPIIEHEIETVYFDDNNNSSHFNTVTDAAKIYKEILKFSASSFTSFLIDYALYTLLLAIGCALTVSNVIARIISASVNFTLNRKLVFRSDDSLIKSAFKYACLAICILIGNTLLLNLLVNTCGINKLIAKIITEITFYILSWLVQRMVVFKRGNNN